MPLYKWPRGFDDFHCGWQLNPRMRINRVRVPDTRWRSRWGGRGGGGSEPNRAKPIEDSHQTSPR